MSTTTPAALGGALDGPAGRAARFGILFAPVTLLIVLFLVPFLIMVQMSVVKFPPRVDSGYTLDHYVEVLTNPLNPHIAWTTFTIATTAMIAMLLVAIPLAYFMVFKARGGSCSCCSRSCSPTSSRRS